MSFTMNLNELIQGFHFDDESPFQRSVRNGALASHFEQVCPKLTSGVPYLFYMTKKFLRGVAFPILNGIAEKLMQGCAQSQ